jgi:adenine-specific DNA-methyltransferase
LSLFAAREENPPLREAIDFYKHAHNWSNRLIAGDSLLVMNSLIEKEGMAGQVQMLHGPALRHKVRLKLPALHKQA